jgi:hypothetical protein
MLRSTHNRWAHGPLILVLDNYRNWLYGHLPATKFNQLHGTLDQATTVLQRHHWHDILIQLTHWNFHASIVNETPQPTTLDEWQTKALEKQIKYLVKREILGKRDKSNQKGCLYQALKISKNRGRSNGGNWNNQICMVCRVLSYVVSWLNKLAK